MTRLILKKMVDPLSEWRGRGIVRGEKSSKGTWTDSKPNTMSWKMTATSVARERNKYRKIGMR